MPVRMAKVGTLGLFSDLYGNTGKINENEERLNALAQIAGERPKPKGSHRANLLVGGDFAEIGSGYYSAMSEYAKTGASKAEGENANTTILQDIFNLLFGVVNNKGVEPNRNNMGNALPGAV